MQLIVGLETPADFQFDKELHLDMTYSMLRDEQWDEAERIVEPLLEKMYTTIQAPLRS
ncbi:hypothetical protein D3C85_1868360 [compost metagenome]